MNNVSEDFSVVLSDIASGECLADMPGQIDFTPDVWAAEGDH